MRATCDFRTFRMMMIGLLLTAWMASASAAPGDEEKTKNVVHPGYGNYTESYGDLEIPMIWLPGGNYILGRRASEELCEACWGWASWAQHTEVPLVPGELPGFWISATEITVAQYRAFVAGTKYKTFAEIQGSCQTSFHRNHEVTRAEGVAWYNPTVYQVQDQMAVAVVTWSDCMEFTKWLSEKTDRDYSLPTEAEWEYTFRAGTDSLWYWGNDDDDSAEYEWFERKALREPPLVGMLKPNPWGLYDMGGNFREYCLDRYGYSLERTLDRKAVYAVVANDKPHTGWYVWKGTGYCKHESWSRAASRAPAGSDPSPFNGFRIVRIPKSQDELPTLPTTATISGKVLIDGKAPVKSLAAPKPPEGSLASMLGQTPPAPQRTGFQLPELIPVDGNPWRYPLDPAPDGSYSVSVIPGSYVLFYRDAELRPIACPQTRIDVESGQNYEHDMNVSLHRAVIKSDNDLSMLADVVFVCLHAALGDGHYQYLYGIQIKNGKAVFEGLPAGEYMIELPPFIFRFYDDPRFTVPEDAPEEGVVYTLPIEGF
ncbi:SUMF1/EgtB/PvdO family nonheme iron enzyme [Candidatus Sumerlaeota bacterium]|nr:SUMF1/EgtB/PvdO family nonheme iron enzyme [Candidatus Sumerlaeota bacterium]